MNNIPAYKNRVYNLHMLIPSIQFIRLFIILLFFLCLRIPLAQADNRTVTIGFTGILLQRMVGPLNDEQIKQLNMVNNSAKHLLDLINDILDISRIEAGQHRLSLSAGH
jgi:signal transduction histidine kinase